MNDLYFACIKLRGRRCLVVGAGAVGHEKTLGLLAAGAEVSVVAPEVSDEVRSLAARGEISLRESPYVASDLDGAFLVIAATPNRPVNERVQRDAEERSMLVNVADVPDLCNLILPAVAREGDLALAVSTNGASPALAKRIRREARDLIDRPHARLAEILASLRPWAKHAIPTYRQRKEFFEDIVDGHPDPVALLRAGREDELWSLIEERRVRHAGSARA